MPQLTISQKSKSPTLFALKTAKFSGTFTRDFYKTSFIDLEDRLEGKHDVTVEQEEYLSPST